MNTAATIGSLNPSSGSLMHGVRDMHTTFVTAPVGSVGLPCQSRTMRQAECTITMKTSHKMKNSQSSPVVRPA